MPQFISASKEINERAAEYWPLVMDIARRNNVKRIMRCGQIMGRSDTDEMSAAQIFYPCMQCADIFFLKARLVAFLGPCRAFRNGAVLWFAAIELDLLALHRASSWMK